MKIYILTLALLITGFAFGQVQVKKSSISCGGGTGSTTTYKVVYSIGEIAMSEKTQGNLHVSEGFVGYDMQQTTGVDEIPELYGLKVFPNPATDILNINFPKNDIIQAELYDLSGKRIIRKITGRNGIQMNVQMLPVGSYLVKVYIKNHTVYYKIIKE